MQYLIFCIIAFAVSYLITPNVIRLARNIGAIDIPKDNRRMHDEPMPLLGGIAIAAGFFMALLIWLAGYWGGFLKFNLADRQLVGMLLGTIIIVAIGILDDIHPISIKIRFSFQVLAALVIALAENKIEFISFPFSESGILNIPPVLSVIITVLWIVGITNAINFMDGLDGLAAGISLVSSIVLFVISLSRGDVTVALLLAMVAGGILGFIPRNFYPAKIFMGSAGSYFLGFVLAVISISGAIKSYATISLILPILVLALPIFDTLFAIIRRTLRGESIAKPDRGHIHHRLIDLGVSHKMSVILLISLSILLGLVAILLTDKKMLPSVIVIGITLISALSLVMYLNQKQKKMIKKEENEIEEIKEPKWEK